MRLVAIADTHLYHDDVGQLPDGDVLVHAGDMLRFGDFEEFAVFVEWFLQLPHEEKIIVAGNHDWCFQRERGRAESMLGRSVQYLEDSAIEIGGLKWWGSPCQPAFNDWASNLSRGEPLREKWRLIPSDVDVLVTHSPPAGRGDRSPVGARHGCEDLRDRVDELRPMLHLFGHIHQDGGLWVTEGITSANVTTWEGDRSATVLDLDVECREVSAVQVPPPGD